MTTKYFRPDTERTIAFQQISGSREKPVLVFLHQGLGCMAGWKDFPERLCHRTGCAGLLYDRIGFGASSPALEKRTVHYLHFSALIELPRLLEGVIPGQSYILVGHSDGASIALLHASQRPSLLRGIISEAAHVYVDETTRAGIRQTVDEYTAGKLEGLKKYHGDKTDAVFHAWCDTWLSDWFADWNMVYALPAVAVPVLVIQGKDDIYGETAQVTAVCNHLGGENSCCMPENCGHTPHHEQPVQILEKMTDFIQSVSKRVTAYVEAD